MPDLAMLQISDLLEGELSLNTANGIDIPYLGWVCIHFSLTGDETIEVPTLVTPDSLDMPIIGTNVITEVVKASPGEIGDKKLRQTMVNSLGAQLHVVSDLIHLLRKEEVDEICVVRSGRATITIPSKKTIGVVCTVNRGPLSC